MPEILRKRVDPSPDAVREPLAEVLPAVRPAGLNDNDAAVSRVGEQIGFEVPRGIWSTMIACYGLFLAALLAATGGSHAAFAIAISLVYVAMFFGTAWAIVRQSPAQPRSPLECGCALQTAFGPLSLGVVVAQMLVVPGVVAFFGIAVLVIRLWLV